MKMRFLFWLTVPLLLQSQVNLVTEGWKNDADLKGAAYGFCVMNCKTGEVVAGYNAQQLLVPASTLKAITTSVALAKLGATYRFETKLYYDGAFHPETGVLEGDLVIRGGGDPSLQSEYFGKASVTDIWAKALAKAGLKQIKGRVVGDASAFERDIPGEWIWADIGNYFGASPCGLSFMDNKFKLFYTSGTTGSEAKLTASSPNYLVQNYQLTSHVVARGSEDEAYVYGDPRSFKKEIKGSIPPGKSNYEVEAALPDPALLCAEALSLSLEKAGVKCNPRMAASVYDKELVKPATKPIYTHYSPTLDMIIFYTNLKSNNQYCESLLRILGNGSMKKGLETVTAFCMERGLPASELFMADGCGLSRANAVTASFVTTMLVKMSKDSSNYRILKNSFPAAGKSGSMANVGRGKFIEDNMRAKTGYINRVRAYCGYVTSRSGKELAFSVMLNNYACKAGEARLKIEKLLIEIGEL